MILVEGDNLVLKYGDRRTEARFTPDVYHALKAVSHIPLALDVMLTSVPDGDPLGDDLLDGLRQYRGRIVDARERILTLRLRREQAGRQTEIILASLHFIDSLIKSRTCPQGSRIAYTRRMAPLVLANAADATRADLDSLHRLVCRWREHMPAGDWSRLTVIVMGRRCPARATSLSSISPASSRDRRRPAGPLR